MTRWVITWRYSDGSAGGVVRVYASQLAAERDLEMLKTHAMDREFTLHAVEYIDHD